MKDHLKQHPEKLRRYIALKEDPSVSQLAGNVTVDLQCGELETSTLKCWLDYRYHQDGQLIHEHLQVHGQPIVWFTALQRMWPEYGAGILRLTKYKRDGTFKVIREFIAVETERLQ
jgi:hypothetical protein